MSRKSIPSQKLQEAVIDGRLANVYIRRQQLSRLRDSVLQSKDAILEAIAKDSSVARNEALAEFYTTMTVIKHYYDELAPADAHRTEYQIANGQDAADAREGVGIVLITAQQAHTFFYSVLVPLCAAIAAGNCVIVVLQQTLRSLPKIITRLLQEALDDDVFDISTSDVEDMTDLRIRVVQGGDHGQATRSTLFSPSALLVVAVVDRTSNYEEAARILVDSRMAFAGRSPYAPDLVLVNEFVKQDFLRAVLKYSMRYLTDEKVAQDDSNDSKSHQRGQGLKGVRTIMSGSNGSILEVEDRTSLAELAKVNHRALRVHGVSSLDDAIEVANDLGGGDKLATYAFGDPETCKYLLQFVRADVGFANLVPTELLIGPAAPQGHPVTLSTRYPAKLFSVPRPKFVQETPLSRRLGTIISNGETGDVVEDLWKTVELEPRAPVKHITGYFERAALVGLASFLTPVLLGSGFVVYSTLWKGGLHPA
ncbi:hypothetical protein ACJZ2D_001291 [Fusarium nematophilum]